MVTLLNPGVIEYDAVIEQSDRVRNSWARVDFPYDIKKLYGKGNLVPVIVMYDSVEYRGSITTMGRKYPMLLIKRDILARLGKKGGDTVHVTVTLDDKPRVVEIPPELDKLLGEDSSARTIFDGMAYTHRKEYCRWVGEAKKLATKERRAAKAFEMIKDKQKFS
jgi:hypothetical protein